MGAQHTPRPSCKRCDSPLSGKRCTDVTCPFSDYTQDDPRGMANHPLCVIAQDDPYVPTWIVVVDGHGPDSDRARHVRATLEDGWEIVESDEDENGSATFAVEGEAPPVFDVARVLDGRTFREVTQ